MQAIQVKYLPCTNTKGSRLSATCMSCRVVVGYDHGLDVVANYEAAAMAVMDKMGWPNKLVGGRLKDGSWTFVILPEVRKTATL